MARRKWFLEGTACDVAIILRLDAGMVAVV